MNKSLDWSLFEEFVGRLNDLWETEAWQKANHRDKTNGLSQKAVNSYRREHPGSKLQTAVTTKPSKLKAGSKAAKRRKSFCARMGGNKGPMKKPNGKPTPKALALRRWHCESIEEMAYMIARGEQMIAEMKQSLPEEAKHGLYYNVNKRKKAGTSRPASSPKAPTAQAWKDAAKTAKSEGVAEGSFGIDDKIKGRIQNIVSDLSDIPGMWDHKAQTFTDAGMDKLKTVLKNNPKYIKYALNLDYRDYEAEGVAEATGDERFDTIMGRMQKEPTIPDSQMPPTDVKDLHHWAVKHHKPYHKIFAKWANREGYKSVAPALQKAGNLDSDALDYWTPDVWKLRFGPDAEMPHHWSKERVPDELRDYLETVFDAYENIWQDWPTEYRQIGDRSVNEGWSQKYKSSINCSHPKGFSQKAHCAGKKKHNESHEVMEMICPDCGMCESHSNMTLSEIAKGAKDSNGVTKCWPGKHAAGTKKGKNGGQVRNCVPNESQGVAEGAVDQLPTQGADYSKYDTDHLKMMLRPGILHRNEARFKALIRKELQKREQQSQQGVAAANASK